MAVQLVTRPPVHEGRQYLPDSEETSIAALTEWLSNANPHSELTIEADEQGFSITTTTDIDGTATVTGVTGDWIVLGRIWCYPEVFTPADLEATFQTVT